MDVVCFARTRPLFGTGPTGVQRCGEAGLVAQHVGHGQAPMRGDCIRARGDGKPIQAHEPEARLLASKAERVADMGLFWSIATVSHRPEDVRAVSRWLTFTQKPRVTVLRESPRIGRCQPHRPGRERPESGRPSAGMCT